MELDMRQTVSVKKLSELCCYYIRCDQHSHIIYTNKISVCLCFPQHNLLFRLEIFHISVQSIIHMKAAFTAGCFEKVFKNKLSFFLP